MLLMPLAFLLSLCILNEVLIKVINQPRKFAQHTGHSQYHGNNAFQILQNSAAFQHRTLQEPLLLQ